MKTIKIEYGSGQGHYTKIKNVYREFDLYGIRVYVHTTKKAQWFKCSCYIQGLAKKKPVIIGLGLDKEYSGCQNPESAQIRLKQILDKVPEKKRLFKTKGINIELSKVPSVETQKKMTNGLKQPEQKKPIW